MPSEDSCNKYEAILIEGRMAQFTLEDIMQSGISGADVCYYRTSPHSPARRGESASTMEPGATPDVPCNECQVQHFTTCLLTAMEGRRTVIVTEIEEGASVFVCSQQQHFNDRKVCCFHAHEIYNVAYILIIEVF